MYPWELQKFIQDRNFYLEGDDLIRATSLQENPQLDHIIYIPKEHQYKMWDYEGNYYEFSTVVCDELVTKKLVKEKLLFSHLRK